MGNPVRSSTHLNQIDARTKKKRKENCSTNSTRIKSSRSINEELKNKSIDNVFNKGNVNKIGYDESKKCRKLDEFGEKE